MISKAKTQYQKRVIYTCKCTHISPSEKAPSKMLYPARLPLGCAVCTQKSMYVRNSKLLLLSFPSPPYFYFPLSCISRVPSSSLPPTFARREYILFLSLSTPPFSRMARKRTREKKKRGEGGGGMAVEYGKLFLPLLLLLFSHILG